MVKDFSKNHDIMKTSTTPESDHLFKPQKIQYNIYFIFFAKALFSTERARSGMKTTVVFISTQVISTEKGDWKKLSCMMRYLRGTPDLKLTLCADRTNIVKWWVIRSHLVHPKFRGHMGQPIHQEKYQPSEDPPSRSLILEVPLIHIWYQQLK